MRAADQVGPKILSDFSQEGWKGRCIIYITSFSAQGWARHPVFPLGHAQVLQLQFNNTRLG